MKKKVFISSLFVIALFCIGAKAVAQTVSISFFPSMVTQGEPLMIQVNTAPNKVKKMTFGGKPVSIFTYKNRPTGIVGMDLNMTPGIYNVTAELFDGRAVENDVEIKEKKKKVASFTIPKKLGGNTTDGQKKLISTLIEENNSFKNLKTGNKIWWISDFAPPLEKITVSDEFGYHRQLGNMIMAHKGVDYRATEGTKVLATNDGIVRAVGDYRNYGKTIVIDHGLGVLSFYLHLSEIKVKVGEFVLKGQNIGLSGQTGYADAPHLHFSIRIYGVSIDPVKFLELFK